MGNVVTSESRHVSIRETTVPAVMSGQDDRELWEPLDAVSKRYQIEYGTLHTNSILLVSDARI